ncbi:MAG: hypothetical protein ACI4EF_04640 [Coprococcus sp.]
MNIVGKMEKKFGRYAIKNLSLYLMIGYAVGYLLFMFAPDVLGHLILVPSLVMKGQVWRLVTWVITPPQWEISIFTLVMLFFYYNIGTYLERTIGAFLYNLYIFGGMLITMVGTMLTYILCQYVFKLGYYDMISTNYYAVTTYYIMLTIFLAVAVCYPDMTVLYAMIIPIKMKYLSILYLVFVVYYFVNESLMGRVNIVLSLVSFVIFYLSTKNIRRFSPKHIKRRRDYTKQVKVNKAENITHKCAVCGITNNDDPDMQFRYCSKCKGNKEYCKDHLFTHTHV